ncbi:hypothetical protein VXS05_18590 [Photobacterium toruni]|uniref:hypothetical protein n=1 Tax=Photobacterium toruni TaxID=1935446 RepID=UPI002E1781AE|nr:hypothetical protein [Photobacterium toruni]
MKWTVLRHDFFDGTVQCRLGKRKHNLESGIVFVIQNEYGDIAYCGSGCAKNKDYVTNPKESIPDFTSKLLFLNDSDSSSNNNTSSSKDKSCAKDEMKNNQLCRRYLELLFVLIPLIDLKANTQDESVNIIINYILKKGSRETILKSSMHILLDILKTTKNSQYSISYLYFIYTYIRQIDFLLNESTSEKEKKLLIDSKSYVKKHHKVSEKQFNIVVSKLNEHNRNIKYIRLL